MQINLIVLRKKNNISQKDLAVLLNISETQYGKKERGQAEFTQDEMFLLSDYFKLKMEEIFLPRNATICCNN